MRTWSYILLLATLVACQKDTLNADQVLQILETSGKYPQVQSCVIYIKDAEDGRKALDAGLDKEGLVTVDRNRKTGDNTLPVIQFTGKASSYLLPPDKGQMSSVQKIKIADEVLDSVLSINVDEQKRMATVRYTTRYIEVNPFAKLDKRDFTQKKEHQLSLINQKGQWVIAIR